MNPATGQRPKKSYRASPWKFVVMWLSTMLLAAPASAAPLPETERALTYEKNLERQDLERRRATLHAQQLVRRDHLARRLNALYRLAARRTQANDKATKPLLRLTRRDKSEWAAVVAEQQQVEREKGMLDSHFPATAPRPPQVASHWPVTGAVVRSFGLTYASGNKNSSTIYHPAIEIATTSGGRVIAPAAARVTWRGTIPGHGEAVLLDVGENYSALLAHLRPATLALGKSLQAGTTVGNTDRNSLLVALVYQGVPIDPLGWLPVQKRAASPTAPPAKPSSPALPPSAPTSTQLAAASRLKPSL